MSYHDAMEWLGGVDPTLVNELLAVLEERQQQTWRVHAACRTTDTAVFFPTRGTPNSTIDATRAICGRCPVATECLAAGTAGRQPGIWGGTSERERRTLRANAPAA